MAHAGMGRLNVKTFISSGNACSISRAVPGVWSHLLRAWVWESRWTLFTLEESEKPGSPILKLTGPFGSNHQMCHGKKAPCHTARDAKPLPASIFSFKAGNWCQCDRAYVHQTFFPNNSTGVSLRGAAEWQKMNDYLFISSDTLRRAKVRRGRETDKKKEGMSFISVTLLSRMFG